MANEIYITAGLPAIDSADIVSVAQNAFYITAGLTANDYAAAPATLEISVHDCAAAAEALH